VPEGRFDVTSPELLLGVESPPLVDGSIALGAPAPPVAPPAPEPVLAIGPALRPGETVARASDAGIVIRREKRERDKQGP
jgi:hypothetical protein